MTMRTTCGALAAMLVALSAFADVAFADTMTMWVRASGVNAATHLVDLWNSTHPDKIELTTIPDNQMVTKLATGVQAGDVPDLVSFDLSDGNAATTLADYLKTVAPQSAARFVVSAGHIHNYERFAQDGVMYLVSGGGGAKPYEVERTPADLYQDSEFPNYHYVRFELRGNTLLGEMMRLNDYSAPVPRQWQTRDRFEITLRP